MHAFGQANMYTSTCLRECDLHEDGNFGKPCYMFRIPYQLLSSLKWLTKPFRLNLWLHFLTKKTEKKNRPGISDDMILC